jgi:IMP dehydrogenase/GMP reductase
MTYGLNDIGLIPAPISDIRHRSECNVYNDDNVLPIFTAPMNAVINEHNYQLFLDQKINTIIPRGVPIGKRLELCTKTFVALSLQEFEAFFYRHAPYILENIETVAYICVDIANGHMRWLLDLCQRAKEKYGGQLLIMTGNIANPDTYVEYAKVGIDFCRVNIGTGSCCTTSSNATGFHYGAASLIKQVADKKWEIEQSLIAAKDLSINCAYKNVPFIVADGGLDSNDKIIKALALGADYVMIGKLFAQCEEACGDIVTKYIEQDQVITYQAGEMYDEPYYNTDIRRKVLPIQCRVYYGMSTYRAQKETGRTNLTSEEGIVTYVPIKYTLTNWVKQFEDNLRSSMSYANAKSLIDFKNTKYCIISNAEYLAIKK